MSCGGSQGGRALIRTLSPDLFEGENQSLIWVGEGPLGVRQAGMFVCCCVNCVYSCYKYLNILLALFLVYYFFFWR
jgi:hypothetical protein